jgi:hypothetical protein
MLDIRQTLSGVRQWLEWIAEDYRTVELRLRRAINDDRDDALWTNDRTSSDWDRSPSFTVAPNAIIDALLKRASWELFDWLGVDRVPTAYWSLLASLRNPGQALEAFAATVRIDSLRLRSRLDGELTDFRTIATLLAQAEVDRSALARDMRYRLDAIISQGDSQRVGELLQVLTLLNDAAETHALVVRMKWFRAHALFADRVQALRNQANRVSLRVAKAIWAESEGWKEVAYAYRAIVQRISGEHATRLEPASVDLVERTLQKIHDLRLENAATALLDLQLQLDAMSDGTESGKEVHFPSPASIESLRHDNALRHFREIAGEALTSSTIQTRFRSEVMDKYPYPGQPDYSERAFAYRCAFGHRNALIQLQAEFA